MSIGAIYLPQSQKSNGPSRNKMRHFCRGVSKPNSKSEGDNVCGDLVIIGVMVPEFGVELKASLTQSIGDAAANILAEGICTRAAGNDLYLADSAAIPP